MTPGTDPGAGGSADGDRLILNIRGGVRIVVPNDLASISTYVFLEQEDWFEDEAALVRRLAQPGFRMLDIGANVGFYSLTAAAASGGDSKIVAFEPTPEVAALMRASIAANGFPGCVVHEFALGERDGTLVLERGDDSALNRVTGNGSGTTVPVRTLDAVAAGEGLANIDFVKIDVEGSEAAVVAGGRDFFARESPLVMFEVVESGELRLDAAHMLEQLGYRLFELTIDPLLLVPFAGKVAFGRLNLFAAKGDRAAALADAGLLARSPEPVGRPCREEILELLSHPAALAAAKPAFHRALGAMADDDPFLLALSAYAQSLRPDASPDQRAGGLLACFREAEAALQVRATAPRLMLAARIARRLGMTAHAGQLANQLALGALQGARFAINEPFPVLLPHYESWVSPGGLGPWLTAMCVEAWWMWSAFSDQFRATPLPVPHPSELLASCGRRSPAFERRRQLWELRSRRQSAPVAAEILAQSGSDNLNTGYWLRGRQGSGA